MQANVVQITEDGVRGLLIIEMGEKHDSTGRSAFRRTVVATTDPSDAVQMSKSIREKANLNKRDFNQAPK